MPTEYNLFKKISALFLIFFFAQITFAQDPLQQEERSGANSRAALVFPQKGVCPLPILPELPAYDDTDFYAEKNVPHGKIEKITYENYAGETKRMHIYLPPGYENEENSYPVLYLNHGGGDDDSKWSLNDQRSGGAANLIFDNLIAEGKAKPAIIVMPNTPYASSQPSKPNEDDVCTREYRSDIIPYIDSQYRVKPGRENRAIAGLSMGGFVVMNTGLPHLDTFSELYVYSSGYTTPETIEAFENNFREVFEDPNTNNLLRVPFYMAAGETDIALLNAQKVMSIFNKYGIRNFWVLSDGGHEWTNWRRYLYQTLQIMFPDNY